MIVVFCDSNVFIDASPQSDEEKILESLKIDPSFEHVLLESVEKEIETVIQKFRRKNRKLILDLIRLNNFNDFQKALKLLLKNRGMSPLERVRQKYGDGELFDRRRELLELYSKEIDEIEKKFYFFTDGIQKHPFNRNEIEEKRRWIHLHYGKLFGRRKADENHLCGVLGYNADKKIFITKDNFFFHGIKKEFVRELKNCGIEIYKPTRFFNEYYLVGYG
ncbi:MAG: hypothetical protein J7L58_03715 [Thermoplasmata archaeon]|nr:hypothetical protein [Thermoplasmata archaeon]